MMCALKLQCFVCVSDLVSDLLISTHTIFNNKDYACI